MLQTIETLDNVQDYDVRIQVINADDDFNAFVDDVKRNTLDAVEVGEPVQPQPAPERRTHPEYQSIKDRREVLGTIPTSTAPAFLAAVQLKYNAPVLAVDEAGDVRYTGPADPMLYGKAILGPDDALDLGTLIADHLGNKPLATIEVEPVAGGLFRAVRVYPWGGRVECAGLHSTREAAEKYGAWMIQTERRTVAAEVVVEAGETGRAA